MTEDKSKDEKVQRVLSVLSGKDCIKCGYDSCEELG
jgi:Na+-translocating ferredoxin:NAD+ oxidoreductase RNF subunit RnfB